MTPNIVNVDVMASVGCDQDSEEAERLNHLLQQFVGKPNTEETRQQLVETLTKFYQEPQHGFQA